MPQGSTKIMAHIFQIPVSFEFRTVKIQWQEACAKVIGWRNGDLEGKKPGPLIAELARGLGKSRIAIPLSKIPEAERKHCLATLGKRHPDEMVKEICSALELKYFVHNRKSYFGGEVRKYSLPNDAWQMRDDFLRMKDDPKKIGRFLNTWGRWVPLRNFVGLSEISELQESVRAGLEAPEKWFATVGFPTMSNSGSTKFPYFTMLTDACQVAVRMTVTIDLLRQIEFKKCARWDCPVLFPVKSQRKKTYCHQYCAHLESMRRGRMAKRSV